MVRRYLAVGNANPPPPWGGFDMLLSTNPFAAAIPAGAEPPIVLDMATTVAAPPQCVWPWLVQMGSDRAGFYSFDRLDNGGRPSSERLHPHWQNLRQGGRIA